MTTHSPAAPSRDANANAIVTGVVYLADGTTETVEELDAWADAFENDDRPSPLTAPRPGRPNLARRRGHPDGDQGESPRITIRVPTDLLNRIDTGAASAAVTRAEFVRAAIEIHVAHHEAAYDLADLDHYLDFFAIYPMRHLEARAFSDAGAPCPS